MLSQNFLESMEKTLMQSVHLANVQSHHYYQSGICSGLVAICFHMSVVLLSGLQDSFALFTYRAIKDPKVRKERWGLLARRETKAGQAYLEPLDPRVTRYIIILLSFIPYIPLEITAQ